MTEKIKLVANDTRPQLRLTLTDETTGQPIDLTGSIVRMYFRQVGSEQILDTLLGVVTNPAAGEVIFMWKTNTLAVDPGEYEGEVEVTDALGGVQTMYELLKFKLRQGF